MEEPQGLGLGDHQQAVGLGPGRRQLRHQLVPGHPDRRGQPELAGDARPDQRGHLRRGAEQQGGPAHVEERLVQGQRLDQGGDVQEDLAESVRVRTVGLEVGRDEHGVRAQPAGPDARHGRVEPAGPGQVGGGHDHAARRRAADHHRPAGERRILQHLDRGVEGIQVDVEDRLRRARG